MKKIFIFFILISGILFGENVSDIQHIDAATRQRLADIIASSGGGGGGGSGISSNGVAFVALPNVFTTSQTFTNAAGGYIAIYPDDPASGGRPAIYIGNSNDVIHPSKWFLGTDGTMNYYSAGNGIPSLWTFGSSGFGFNTLNGGGQFQVNSDTVNFVGAQTTVYGKLNVTNAATFLNNLTVSNAYIDRKSVV